jgi:ubiquinone/menaquinone biosynthesis C-methylase UbiE
MSDSVLNRSWSAFPREVAPKYLKSFGSPSLESKRLVYEVLKERGGKLPRILDVGCGNANLAEYLDEQGLQFNYTGTDFSDVLLEAAGAAFPGGTYVKADAGELAELPTDFDFAVYSHVIEMLPSPEASLSAAAKLAKSIIIRFFEPPAERYDSVELLEMDVGGPKKVPYLRRKLSQSYYELMLSNIGCRSVDVYRTGSKDQVHVLNFSVRQK